MSIDVNLPITVTLVEDNLVLLEELLYQLMLAGFNVRGVRNAEDLDVLMQEWQSEIYVLDINLPSEDGFSIAKRLLDRQQRGIIMLTARTNIADKLQSLEDGVDFYLTKPVDWRELAACIKNLYYRLKPEIMPLNWALDLSSRQLTAPVDRVLNLTLQEINVLKLLLENPKRIVDRKTIEAVFMAGGEDIDSIYGRINTQVSRLRDKLARFDSSLMIQTHRAVGYAFIGPNIEIREA
jgi:DNA-binding response OmpR family regulator